MSSQGTAGSQLPLGTVDSSTTLFGYSSGNQRGAQFDIDDIKTYVNQSTTTIQQITPVAGQVVSLVPGTNLITPTATIATLTVIMPTAPTPNYELVLAFTAAVTTLTMTDTGGFTIRSPLTSATANSFGRWRFYLNQWVRVG